MELKFKRDTSFRKQFFVPESFAHPAKMDAHLLLWIVERYTKPGEVILDPMAGMGTTMLACTLGRHCVLVELEEKFCNMCKSNWERVSAMPQLGYEMGQCNIIQGDARQLEGLVDKIVTSPPYALTVQKGHEGVQAWKVIEGFENASKETLRAKSKELAERGEIINQYGQSKDNIGNLPYGQIDKIVTSPPYGDEPTVHAEYLRIRFELGRDITKPSQRYAKYDSIITSPPYEAIEARESSQEGYEQSKWGNDSPYFRSRGQNTASKGYSASEDNIGNLKSESYLEAMLQVYQQCQKVLKRQGLMILVTKNFIREKKVVRLDEDTIKLCEQIGFSFLERHYRKLSSQSFWRIIYHHKYPEVEQIKSEDILVFRNLTIHNTPFRLSI